MMCYSRRDDLFVSWSLSANYAPGASSPTNLKNFGEVSSNPVGFARQKAKMDVPLRMNSGTPGAKLIAL